MDELTHLIEILTQIGPLGTVALSLVVLWQGLKQGKNLDNLKENHLHEVKESLNRLEKLISDSQERQASILNEIKTGIEIIKVKMNGKK